MDAPDINRYQPGFCRTFRNFVTPQPMSIIQPYVVQDEDTGTEYTVYIQTDDEVIPKTPGKDAKRDGGLWDENESYGPNSTRSTVSKETLVKLREVNGTIRTYAKFVIDAFKNMGGAEVEELNFKFGLKFSGGANVPVLVKGSAESNFEVEVKCKFPK
ncbi:MAG: CU044_2847 family protein [Cyanobacteria bacterium P01_D01_bin.156]